MKPKTALLAFLSFLFLFFPTALATDYIAGSSYFYDFPTCNKLNITLVCSQKIDLNEFYFCPNCSLAENQTFVNKWVCDCWDGYRLNFTINPASQNTCDILMVYTYGIEVPEKTVVIEKYYEYPVRYYYNQTVNYTVEKNVTDPAILKLIEDLSKTLEEKNKEIMSYRENISSLENYTSNLKFKLDATIMHLWKVTTIITIIILVVAIALVFYFFKAEKSMTTEIFWG